MPHIFFERLERRISTQILVGYKGFSGTSMGQSYSGYGARFVYCYALGPMWYLYGGEDGGLYGGLYGGEDGGLYGGLYGMYNLQQEPSIYQLLYQTQWQTNNAWNSSTPVPSMNFLNTFQNNNINSLNLLTSPTAPIKNLWQTPTFLTPSFGYPKSYEYGISGNLWPDGQGSIGYLIGGFPGTPMSGGISKLEKVRENLIAFFQHKGILSGNQGKRLVFSLFDKA